MIKDERRRIHESRIYKTEELNRDAKKRGNLRKIRYNYLGKDEITYFSKPLPGAKR